MSISYNGHGFSEMANFSFNTIAVYDDTGRTIIGHETTVSVVDFIHGECTGSNTSPNTTPMQEAKTRLMIAGKRLSIENLGFGDALLINFSDVPASDWDIAGGPRPVSCNIENIGAGNVSQITWTCKFQLAPGCAVNKSSSLGLEGSAPIKAFCWKTTHTVDQKGFTNRNITGYLEIVNLSDDELPTTTNPPLSDAIKTTYESALADSKRYVITNHFPPLENFERTQNYDMSLDHSRLSFSLNDREIQSPNAWPEDVVQIRMPTSATFPWPSAQKDNGGKATISIDFTIELRQGAPRVRAWEIFDGLLTQRTGRYAIEGGMLIMQSLTVREDWFSNSYGFSVRMEGTESMYDNIRLLGMFGSIPTNWNGWRSSQWEGEQPYGHADLRAGNETGDAFDTRGQNVCNEATDWKAPEETPYQPEPKWIYAQCAVPPPRNKSFLKSDVYLSEEPEMQTSVQTTYAPVEITQSYDNLDDQPQNLIKVTGLRDTCISESAPLLKYVFSGYTQRVHYKIPAPALEEIGGQKVKLVGEPYFQTRYLGKQLCLNIYEAEWYQEYVVVETPEAPDPDSINYAPDFQPFDQTDGGDFGVESKIEG